jgi:hypothetical protein
VCNVKQGWESLCTFFCMALPECPFPKANDKAFMSRIVLDMHMPQIMGLKSNMR